MDQLITRWLEFVVAHARQVLIGFVAASLLVLTGFARADVDTDPARVLDERSAETGADDELVVTLTGERPLLQHDVLVAVRDLQRGVESIDGVDAAGVVGIADAIQGAVPSTRSGLNDLSARIRSDSSMDGVVASADRRVLSILVPLSGERAAGEVADEVRALIAEQDALDDVGRHVTGFVLVEERIADSLYGQVLTRTIIGWLLAFVVLTVLLRQLVLAALAAVLVAAAVVWTLALSAAFGGTVGVASALVPAAALVVAIGHVARPLTGFYEHPGVLDDPKRVIVAETRRSLTAALVADAAIVAALVALVVAGERYDTYAWSLVITFVVASFVGATVVPASLAALDAKFLTAAPERDLDDGVLASVALLLPAAGVRFRDPLLSLAAVAIGLGAVGIASTALDDNPLRWLRGGSVEARDIAATADRGIGATSAVMTLDADLVNQLTSRTTLGALESLRVAWDVDPRIGASQSYTTLVGSGDAAERRAALEAVADGHVYGSRLVDVGRPRAEVRVWLRDADADAARWLIDSTASRLADDPLNPGVTVTWSGEAIDNITWQTEAVRDPARGLLIAAVVGIGAALALVGSLRWTVFGLAPAALAYLSVFGFLGWRDGVHGVPSAVGGLLLVVSAVEIGLVVAAHYRAATRRSWSRRQAADELGSGPARGIVVGAVVSVAAMAPLALADLLPAGRGGSLLILGAGVGALAALVIVPAAAAGPPRNTAPLEVRGATPA